MNTFYPEVFQNKTWSGPKVLHDTLKDLQKKHVVLLKEKSDIDFYKDLTPYPDLLNRMNAYFDEREN